jgi:hypothetical protein
MSSAAEGDARATGAERADFDDIERGSDVEQPKSRRDEPAHRAGRADTEINGRDQAGSGVDDDDPRTARDDDQKRSGRWPEGQRMLARGRPRPDH